MKTQQNPEILVTGPGKVVYEDGHLVFYPDNSEDFLKTMFANQIKDRNPLCAHVFTTGESMPRGYRPGMTCYIARSEHGHIHRNGWHSFEEPT